MQHHDRDILSKVIRAAGAVLCRHVGAKVVAMDEAVPASDVDRIMVGVMSKGMLGGIDLSLQVA